MDQIQGKGEDRERRTTRLYTQVTKNMITARN